MNEEKYAFNAGNASTALLVHAVANLIEYVAGVTSLKMNVITIFRTK